MPKLRAVARKWANQLFSEWPILGEWGYDFLRITNLTHASREVKVFLQAVKKRGFVAQSILDVGANNAQWSKIARSVYPTAQFGLIEPQQEMEPFLQRFCAKSADSRYWLAGAGAIPGSADLTLWDDLQGSTFLPSAKKYGNQRTIPIITLDQLIEAGEPIPDLVKIDVQGFELEVLKGATRCFGRTQMWILELTLLNFPEHPAFETMINFMRAHGYVVYDLLDLKRRPYDGALAQIDLCFILADHPLRHQQRWD